MNFDTYTLDVYQCRACDEEFSDERIANIHLDFCIDFDKKSIPKAYEKVKKTIVKRYKSHEPIAINGNGDGNGNMSINVIVIEPKKIDDEEEEIVYKKKRLLDRAVSCDQCGDFFTNRHVLKAHKYIVHSY